MTSWKKNFADSLDVLAAELAGLETLLGNLSDEDWYRPTHLVPEGEGVRPWRVIDLVAHIAVSIGLLTQGLLDTIQHGQPGRDRTSFFIANRREVAPVVYDYAVTTAADHTPASLLEHIRSTFAATVERSRAARPDVIGFGYFALMRLDEWIPSRVVEAVVHGMDLTDALGLPPSPTPAGIEITAEILDDLLARKTVAGRPADLVDDLDWIRAASGRGPHPDPRLPLII
jgi:uncharacterized protein (TIGR03083 family)